MPGRYLSSRSLWRGSLLWTAVALIVVLFATPALAAPTITLEPSEGTPGDSFQISGEGFRPGDLILITWDGSKLGDSFFADAEGGFTKTRIVPDDAQPGGHTVEAEGRPPNRVSASATFTVGSSDSTTTTTSSEATTTTESGDEAVEANPEKGKEVAVTEFTITPGEAEAGSVIRVEGTLTGDIDRVQLWLGDEPLGFSIVINEDGSFQATRTIPDLEPGVYPFELRNPGGRLLVSRLFRVLSESEAATTTTTVVSSGEGETRLRIAGPGMSAALLVLLVILILVWWMYRRPKEEDEQGKRKKKSTAKNSDWRFWRRLRSAEAGPIAGDDLSPAQEPTAEESPRPPEAD